MSHLASLAEENGKKGLTVLAITNEPQDIVRKYVTQLAAGPLPYVIGSGGGSENYPASGIPKAFLVGVDGKIVWEGNPASFDEKLLEAELKKVKVTDEMRTARAEKGLAYAETLITAKEYLRAANLLDRIAKDYAKLESGKKAADRRAALDKDEAVKKELTAQKEIDKAVGGVEMPKEKFKKKDRDGVAKSLDGLAKKFQTDAPGAASMATAWAKVVREDWVDVAHGGK
jgi:uncharacterized membrane-anchored protein YhcB (DUF1043 family)